MCDWRQHDEGGSQGYDGAHERIERRNYGSVHACWFVPVLSFSVEIKRCAVISDVWDLYDYFLCGYGTEP